MAFPTTKKASHLTVLTLTFACAGLGACEGDGGASSASATDGTTEGSSGGTSGGGSMGEPSTGGSTSDGGSAGSTTAGATTGGLPGTITTREFPNGIAVDDQYIYVVIGEPHSGPNSQPLAAGSESVVQVFALDDGALVQEIAVAGGGHSLRMTPDGEKIYVAHFSLDQRVTAISTASLEVVAEIGGPLQGDISVPDALAISGDGQWVYVGNNGLNTGWISRIATATDTSDAGWRVDVEGGYTCWVEVSKDPDILYANSWTGGTVQRKSVGTQTSEVSTGVGDFPHSITVTPDGQYLYAMVSGGNRVAKLDAMTLEEIAEIPGPYLGKWGGPVTGVLSASGDHIFVANHALGSVAVLDIDPGSPTYDTVVDTLDVGANPIFQALTPDGTRLVVANNESATLSILDVSSWP